MEDIDNVKPTTPYDETGLTSLHIAENGVCGQEVCATVKSLEEFDGYGYFIVEWGDGTQSYDGPYFANGTGKLKHIYYLAGEYTVQASFRNLDGNGKSTWSKKSEITVSGEAVKRRYIAYAKSVGINDETAFALFDNDIATYVNVPHTVGFIFDGYYTLDKLEVQFVEPENGKDEITFSVEYTTDGGVFWYNLPKYFYMYDYFVGKYAPKTKYPYPSGKTLVFALDGICANGIRIVSYEGEFCASEMRVTGNKKALFYTSLGGQFDADLNNMFSIYGSAKTEPDFHGDPFRCGRRSMTGSAEWINWDGIKLRWNEDNEIHARCKRAFDLIRTGSDGWSGADTFVWATANSPMHLEHQRHYTQNSLFIIEARNRLLSVSDTKSFLESENKFGQKLFKRLSDAMNYLVTTLGGESGIITINDPMNLAKAGKEEGGSQSSNYWDRFSAFGYKSAYENIFFYQSLLAMRDIKSYLGDDGKADYYSKLAEKAKAEFNILFWDCDKGRYITSINKEGKRLDFGLTFVNFMACSAGLASEEQAKQIYKWVDGERIVADDTSSGEDIYHFGFSARTNTLDIASVYDDGHYWVVWDSDMYCDRDWGAYGMNIQNGGTIFYISYYDLLGRIKYIGADDAFERFESILEQFHKKNQLRIFTYPTYIGYEIGIIGEFPESGLVPTAFVEGCMGIYPEKNGLSVCPKLPSGMDYAGVTSYRFKDKIYNIRADKSVSKMSVSESNDGIFDVVVPNGKQSVIGKEK